MRALIEFLGGYEPLYPRVASGYPPSEIERLERALGRPLPAVYRDFLATAGANVGFPLEDLTFDMDELVELALNKRPTLPPTLTPIAVDTSPSYADYFLDLGRPVGDGDGVVIRSAAGSDTFEAAFDEFHSLRDMLFFWGFERIRKLTLQHRSWISWELAGFADPREAPTIERLHDLLVHLGFRALDVTGPNVPLYERGDCAASVYRSMHGPTFAIYLAASSERAVGLVAETLCDGMPGHGVRHPG
jgi:hypothetical protein